MQQSAILRLNRLSSIPKRLCNPMTQFHRMPIANSTSIRQQLARTVGPAPWYWKTFPEFHSVAGQRFVWTHHGDEGPVGYVVSLSLEQEPDKPRLALNTYCRPFVASPGCLGIWCPEGEIFALPVSIPINSSLLTLQKSRDGSSRLLIGSTRGRRQSLTSNCPLRLVQACTKLTSPASWPQSTS